MSLPPGKRLGPYEIGAAIGAGGMGEVYRARDTRLERDVAIKVLPEETAQDASALSRFKREARAIAALQHPNITALYDVGVEGGTAYAVMELLEGETLRERISRKHLPWRRAAEIAAEIAEGLAAAHAKGVIHRDLKPENVILTRDGRVKILDFGLAKHTPDVRPEEIQTATDTQLGAFMGTPGYMAPEQVRGEPSAAVADIFSLGCVLYEMVAGRRAFAGDSAVETLAATLTMQPARVTDLVSEVPDELDGWIAHCIEKNPGERLQSARDLGFALRALLGDVQAHRKAIDSLAVLPFSTAVDTPDSDYLCDGITETIINSLAQLPRLRVIARSTVFRHKGRDVDPIEIGRDLGVGAVLIGRVAQRGELLVIGAELADVAGGSQLWGHQYKRKLADIFEIQDEIATEICETLRLKLTGEEHSRLTRRYTEDPVAYQLYMKGRYCWNQRTEDGMRKATDYFSQAIEQDPAYARAYTGLGDCYAMLSIYDAMSPAQAFPKSKAAQRRALEIDDGLAEAHASLGFSHLYFDWDPRKAEAELKRAVALNSGYASAHQWFAMYLGLTGHLEQADAEMRVAQQLDPFSASINITAAWPLYWMRRHAEAIARFREAVALHPHFWNAHYHLGLALIQGGSLAEAISHLERAYDLGDSGWRLCGLGHAYALAGKKALAHRVIDEAIALSARRYVSPVHVGLIYAALGEPAAFDWLDKAIEARSWFMTLLEVDPLFDPIRGDERFEQLVHRVWRQSP